MSPIVRTTRDTGTCNSINTCETSIRLASKVSGTTSVAPASCRSLIRVSSCVRTRMGTSGRNRRMLRKMPTEVAESEKLITTAVAVSRPALARICSSAESPNMTGSPA